MPEHTNIERPPEIKRNRIISFFLCFLGIFLVSFGGNFFIGSGIFWFSVGILFFGIGQHHYLKWYDLVQAQKRYNKNH
jgi:hypothetical protein